MFIIAMGSLPIRLLVLPLSILYDEKLLYVIYMSIMYHTSIRQSNDYLHNMAGSRTTITKVFMLN